MEAREGWVLVMVAVLNWHYCDQGLEVTLRQHGPCSGVQQTALDRLYALAHSFVAREVSPCTKSSWDEDLRARAAHYDGDLDVCLAQPLTLEQIAAALPPDEVVASIPLRAVCTGSVLEDIMDPERVRLPEQEVEEPLPRAKLHFADGEADRIVAHLARIGLVAPIEESMVWTHRGTKLRSGLFGVEKRGEQISDADSRSKLRLICNLKPSNAVQRMIDGDLAQLPCSTQWNGLQLEHYEVLLMSSSDRQCFFYIFEMERSWQGALALDGLWKRELFPHVPSEVRGPRVRAALRALPMGWLSAVGVSPHAHRNLLRRAAPGADFQRCRLWRRPWASAATIT